MVPATTHLIGFSGETIWPLGQIALLVKIGDEVHSTSAWMNFMVIRRHVSLQSSRLFLWNVLSDLRTRSSLMQLGPPVLEEKINIAIHPEYPEQTVAIGSTLTEKGRKELCSLLKQNLDIFAWKPADMTVSSYESIA
ncbi:hypothetical protein Tco_1136329 [Tanacetum coccineum]